MTFYIIACSLFTLCTAFVIKSCRKSKRPFRTAAVSALSGTASLFAVNIIAPLTGVEIAVNYLSAAVAAVLGLPGVVMLLLARISSPAAQAAATVFEKLAILKP